MSADALYEVVEVPARRTAAKALVRALRPRQWTKNLLLFAGIVFAAKLGDGTKWLEAGASFVAYCAASSAGYLVNDVMDRDADRAHPVKRLRPVASGALTPRAALTAAGALFAASVALALPLGLAFLGLLIVYAALQGGYSLRLKHVVLIDVFTIAALFVVRAAAGAEAVHVRISPWLLLCTGLLALFLALAKRRGELVLVLSAETPGRRVLEGYSLPLIDQLVTVVASATIVSYALYTFTARESHTMMITIPYVVFGIFRYLLLLHRQGAGEEPDQVLVTDVPILAAVALFGLTCAAILAAS
ncbi:MAG TPA: decaprenyl-phosphate phosphoribosyltransferase [Gaiellaceae bacterium]